jgi:hypothetical protein
VSPVRTIETEIDVAAPPDQVWAVLTDFAAYPEWNPFLVQATGRAEVGERLTVTLAPPGRRPITMKPRVQVVEPEQQFAWLGHLLVPGLFDGRHEFRLEPRDGGTRFVQREEFGGALVRLLGSKLFDQTRQGFEAMNQALAERSAGRGAGPEGAT